jgi:hypothetical protein
MQIKIIWNMSSGNHTTVRRLQESAEDVMSTGIRLRHLELANGAYFRGT